jgi:histidinol-phosphatase (PHP family)
MSIHFIKHWQNQQWVFNFEYSESTIQRQYHDYFEAMLKGIETGLFDVVGHLDIIKRPGFPVLNTNSEDVEKVLEAVKQKNMSIEINTSGLRKPVSEVYPALEIIKMAVKKEIPLTMASDAHTPEHVGYYFDLLTNHLFNYKGLKVAHYNKRKCFSRLMAPQEIE